MELFAIISGPGGRGIDRRSGVKAVLVRQLNREFVMDYLAIFDNYYKKNLVLQYERGERRVGPDSVKVLKICNEINKELTYKQKVIVLVQLFEFVRSNTSVIHSQELEFVQAIAGSFYIPGHEHNLIRDFTLNPPENVPQYRDLLLVDNAQDNGLSTRHLTCESFIGQMWVIHLESANMYFVRYMGDNEILYNGQPLQKDKAYVLNAGASIRDHFIKPLYFSDIVSIFNNDSKLPGITFEAGKISYKFKNNITGLHEVGFAESSGRLVGIMGSSGAGKSTLLNILNGSMAPDKGRVLINGIDIYRERQKVEGLIGHVSQDDLLMEDLTVKQNLLYMQSFALTITPRMKQSRQSTICFTAWGCST